MTTSIKAKLWKDKRTLTLVECKNWINYLCICLYKIISKFDAKLIQYMLLFKDILTYLGLDYRDALLITLYLVVIGISIKKCCQKRKKSVCFKWTYRLSGNDYRVAARSKSYLTVIGISMQSLKSIWQF